MPSAGRVLWIIDAQGAKHLFLNLKILCTVLVNFPSLYQNTCGG